MQADVLGGELRQDHGQLHVCPFCVHGCIDNLFITITLVARNVTRGSDQVPLSYMHLGKFTSLYSETLK